MSVLILPGTGESLATDNCGVNGHVELVKIGVSSAGSTALVPANTTDGVSVKPTNQSGSTCTETSVNDTASDAQLLASNASRKFFSIYNDSSSILYVRFSGSAASTTAFNIYMLAGAYWESGTFCYTGEVRGIWSADSTGAARIAEA